MLTRRIGVVAALMVVGAAPLIATAGSASAVASAANKVSAKTPHLQKPDRGRAAPGFVGKGHLKGVYRLLTADVANSPVPPGSLFPPDISATHDEKREVLEVNGSWVDVTLPPGRSARPGQTIEMSGTSDGTVFHGSTLNVAAGAVPAVDTTDVTKTLVILAEWNGKNGDPTTKAKASSVIFTQGNVFWKEVSYGLTSLSGTVVDWVHIAEPTGGNCYGRGDQIMSQARTKAASVIGSLSSYERTIVYFPYCASASYAAGWAYAPGTSVWLNGYMDKRVSLHEQGHNYGLLHAHSIDCSSGALGGTCTASEYGDEFDTMGEGAYVGHYNVAEKARLSWMSGRLHTFASTGTSTSTLAPLETASGVKGGKIAGAGGRTYWVEYRTAVGEDRAFPSGGLGLIVHVTGGGLGLTDGGTNRLDVNRASAYDGPVVALKKGTSWTSPDHVRITFTSSNTSGAQVTVTNGAPLPTAPDAPGSVSTKSGDTTALVSWGIPKDGGDALLGYDVYYQKPGAAAVKKQVNSSGGASHTTTLTELTNGVTYSVWVVARNGVGNSAISAKVPVLPKIQVPTITLTSPTAGQLVNADTAAFAATALPNSLSKQAITSVDFYVDGLQVESDYSAPYGITWDGSYEKDGNHTVQAWATDANNRVAKSALVTFQLKKPVPTVTITSVVPSASDPNIWDIHLAATSGSPSATIDYINVEYDSGNFAGSAQTYPNLDDIVIPWDTHYVSDGNHILSASIGNSLGRFGTSPDFTVSGISHLLPQVAIASPAAGTTQYGNFTITGTAQAQVNGDLHGAPITQVEVIADTNNWMGATSVGLDGTWSIDVQAYQLSVGDHSFVARATDSESFVGSSSPIAVTFAKPTPSADILSPTAGQAVFGNQPGATFPVVIQPHQSDHGGTPIQSIELRVDGVLNTYAQPDAFDQPDGHWSAQLQLSSLTAGAHQLSAYVTDGGQYTGTSSSVSVDIQVPSPSVTLDTIACPNSPCGVQFGVAATAGANQTSNAAIDHVEFLVDGATPQYGTLNGNSYTATIDPNSFDTGLHTITARAVDVNGYQAVSAGQTINFQTAGPSASISTPTPNSTLILPDPYAATAVSGDVFSAGGTSDSPISQIALRVDGQAYDYKYAGDIHDVSKVDFQTAIPAGSHTLDFEVTDEASRVRHSAPVSVKILTKPQAPSGYAESGDHSITLHWNRPDLGGGTISSYTIRRIDPADYVTILETLPPVTDSATLAATDVTYLLSDQPTNEARLFTVSVTTEAGESDQSYAMSGQAYDYTPPPGTTGLTLTGTSSGVTARWDTPTSTDVSFQDVYADAGSEATLYSAPKQLTGAENSTTLTGLTTTGDYTISVMTRDLAGNVGPVASRTVSATSLVLTRGAATLTYGASTVLTAKLTQVTGGALVKAAPITFQWRKKGTTTWTSCTYSTKPSACTYPSTKLPVTGSTSTGTGLAKLTVKPGYSTEYRAIYAGGADRFGRTSGTAAVLVAPKITSSITALTGKATTSVKYGSYIYVKATVSPKHASQTIYLQRLVGTSWKNIVTLKLSTTSTLNYKYKPAKGTFKYRLYKPADSDHAGSYGPAMTLKAY